MSYMSQNILKLILSLILKIAAFGYQQELCPSVNEDIPSTYPTHMENSSSETVNQGQETDSDCEDKQREAALFLLQVKEKTKLPQSVVDNVVQGITVLFKKSVHRLKRKVTELLESEGLSDIAASDSLQMQMQNIFDESQCVLRSEARLESQYKRMNSFLALTQHYSVNYGLDRKGFLSEFPGFKITEQLPQDLMHIL